jgi:hypothetical protein
MPPLALQLHWKLHPEGRNVRIFPAKDEILHCIPALKPVHEGAQLLGTGTDHPSDALRSAGDIYCRQ